MTHVDLLWILSPYTTLKNKSIQPYNTTLGSKESLIPEPLDQHLSQL